VSFSYNLYRAVKSKFENIEISPLAISEAVSDYLAANPVQGYTSEQAQDAIGGILDQNSLYYNDLTPLLSVKRQMSIDADESGLKLSGDGAAPGANKVYGTNASGVKGWKADPIAVHNHDSVYSPLGHGHGSDYAPYIHEHPYEPANSNIQSHITSPHAPADASRLGMAINVQALTSSPTDSQTVYFGMLPKAPTTTANISKVYIRKACTLKIAEIYVYSGTAGSNESWSLYVRKNNSVDTLIATVGVNTNERVFSNVNLNVSFSAGDYFEIKGVQPLWGTNPATTIYGGYLYFE
jgi:hypothetical protein